MVRYHVTLGKAKGRTTVSISGVLSELLALKLGATPGTPEAHSAVKEWLQAQLDAHNDPGRVQVSQWLADQAVLAVVDKMLSRQYDEWVLTDI